MKNDYKNYILFVALKSTTGDKPYCMALNYYSAKDTLDGLNIWSRDDTQVLVQGFNIINDNQVVLSSLTKDNLMHIVKQDVLRELEKLDISIDDLMKNKPA
jgi:hypothetical protein